MPIDRNNPVEERELPLPSTASDGRAKPNIILPSHPHNKEIDTPIIDPTTNN
jgi:hypothetical protein